MRIPRSSIRTTWKTDWVAEVGIILTVLGILVREAVFAAVGLIALSALIALGFTFHRTLTILRSSLLVERSLSKDRVSLGQNLELDLSILNRSKLTVHMLTAEAVAEETLRFELTTLIEQMLGPGGMANAKFTITPRARGRLQIRGFLLRFADNRGLFTGDVKIAKADWIEVQPGMAGTAEALTPLTPLILYGGRAQILRKASSGEDYAGIRKYVSGDEHHRIEWKATARLRTLMVKEFHPEAEGPVQILLDAGKTMHLQSYVGTRLDEALAVAQLLIQSALSSRNLLGIWIFDESSLVKALPPALARRQLESLRQLSLTLRPERASAGPPPGRSPSVASAPTLIAPPGRDRLATFMRLLRLRLRLAYLKTGVYRAFGEATRKGRKGFLIVLTDLQANTEALAETASTQRDRGIQTVTGQIGAAWRLLENLEQAYAEYENNNRTLERLRELGLIVVDVRPERLVETIAEHVGRSVPLPTARRQDETALKH